MDIIGVAVTIKSHLQGVIVQVKINTLDIKGIVAVIFVFASEQLQHIAVQRMVIDDVQDLTAGVSGAGQVVVIFLIRKAAGIAQMLDRHVPVYVLIRCFRF